MSQVSPAGNVAEDQTAVNEMSAKVSVIIPVFNAGRYLRETIDSLLKQTHPAYEIITVDDGSTDDSVAILRSYGDRVCLICQSNQGPAAARNAGIAISQGEYLAFQDADDVALPDRLKHQVEFMQTYLEVGILGSAAWAVTPEGIRLGKLAVSQTDTAIRWQHLLRNPFVISSVMVRRCTLNGVTKPFKSEYDSVEDFELWARILQNHRAANLGHPLVKYRIHPQSLSSQKKDTQYSLLCKAIIKSSHMLLPDLPFSDSELAELGMFVNLSTSELRENSNIKKIIMNYLRLWELFQNIHHDKPDIIHARSDMITIAFFKGIQLLSPRERQVVFHFLKKADRFWWYRILTRLPNVMQSRILRKKMQNLRREEK